MRGLVVPLGERREPRQLERAQRELGRPRGHGPQAAGRAGVGDQALEVGADRAELGRADVEGLAGDRPLAAAHGRLDQILDGEQLVAVRAVAEDRDATALADPVEQDLEHAEPLRADEGLRPQDDDLEPTPPGLARDALGLDLRLAVVADADERRVLADRVVLRDAVDRGRGDRAPRGARPASSAAASTTPVPSTFTERIASREAWIGSAAAAWTSTSAPSTRRASAAGSRTSPRSSSTERSSSASSSGARSSVRTSCPSASSRRARCRPRKPAPPEIAHAHRASRTLRRAARTGPLVAGRFAALVRGRAGGARWQPPRTPGTRRSRVSRSPCAHTGSTTARSTRSRGPRRLARRRRSSGAPGSSRTAVPGQRRAARSARSAQPVFGRRTLRRGLFGWDVSVLQFMLAATRRPRAGLRLSSTASTERALRRYQRGRHDLPSTASPGRSR